jgi:hypothetical protein
VRFHFDCPTWNSWLKIAVLTRIPAPTRTNDDASCSLCRNRISGLDPHGIQRLGPIRLAMEISRRGHLAGSDDPRADQCGERENVASHSGIRAGMAYPQREPGRSGRDRTIGETHCPPRSGERSRGCGRFGAPAGGCTDGQADPRPAQGALRHVDVTDGGNPRGPYRRRRKGLADRATGHGRRDSQADVCPRNPFLSRSSHRCRCDMDGRNAIVSQGTGKREELEHLSVCRPGHIAGKETRAIQVLSRVSIGRQRERTGSAGGGGYHLV